MRAVHAFHSTRREKLYDTFISFEQPVRGDTFVGMVYRKFKRHKNEDQLTKRILQENIL